MSQVMLNEADILFNSFKHYLPSIKLIIKENGSDFLSLSKTLKRLGNSQMDLYYGKLTLNQIYYEVIQSIPANNKVEFENWVTTPNSFKEIHLSDQSTWILRLSDQEAFIHLHPGRYSNFTVRVKATALKTAIMIKGFESLTSTFPSVDQVNDLRIGFLDLSPLKNLTKNTHLNELLELLG